MFLKKIKLKKNYINQNDKWQNDKMTNWQNNEMTTWQNDTMTTWQDENMTRLQIIKINSPKQWC